MDLRFDRSVIRHIERTSENFLRFTAPIARVGELVYRNRDGSLRSEWVTADVLRDSADSIKVKPISLLHPSKKIVPANAREHIAGSTGNLTWFDGNYMWCNGAIFAQDAIDAALNKTAAELSLGYDALTQPRNDAAFDQIKREHNHLSLVPRARATGSGLKFDADDEDEAELEIWWLQDAIDLADVSTPPGEVTVFAPSAQSFQQLTRDAMTYKFTLDGFDFEVDSMDLAKHCQSVQAKLDVMIGEKAALQARADSLATEKSNLEGKVAGLEADNATLKQQAESRSDAAEIESEILSRMDAWGEVLPWLQREDENFQPDYKLSVADVRRTYLEKRTNQKLDGKDAAYIDGMYAALRPTEEERRADSGQRVDGMLDDLNEFRANRLDMSGDAGETKKKARLERIKNNGKALMGGNK